jgi:hypothetical protein
VTEFLLFDGLDREVFAELCDEVGLEGVVSFFVPDQDGGFGGGDGPVIYVCVCVCVCVCMCVKLFEREIARP